MNNNTFYKNESWTDYSSHPEIFVIIKCVLNAALMFIAIIGNSLVLTAISRTPTLRSPSMILLCSLAVSDLLVGLVVQPLFISLKLKGGFFLWQIWSFLTYCCCGISLCTVTALILDRFAALHYHMRYVAIVTTTRVVYTLLPVWFLIFLATLISLWNIHIYFTIASVFIFVCLLISSFCYIRIFQIVKRHQMQIHAQQQSVQSLDAANNLNMMSLKKSSMNTFVFYIFLILCYFPTFVILMLHGILQIEWTGEWNVSFTVVYMNSAVNPMLYCWRLSELRSAVVKTARKMFCTQADQQ